MLFELLPMEMICAIIDFCSFSTLLQLRLTCAASHEAIDLFKKRELLLLDEIKTNDDRCPYCILYKDEQHRLGACEYYITSYYPLNINESCCSSCRRTFIRCTRAECRMICQYTGCSGHYGKTVIYLNNRLGRIIVYTPLTKRKFNEQKFADKLMIAGKKLNVSEIHYDTKICWGLADTEIWGGYETHRRNWREEQLVFGIELKACDMDIGHYPYYKCVGCGDKYSVSIKRKK